MKNGIETGRPSVCCAAVGCLGSVEKSDDEDINKGADGGGNYLTSHTFPI